MPNIERPPFADRAAKEFERIAGQVKDGGQSAEDVINDVVNGVQKLVEDLAEWIANEVDRLSELADEQRRRAETQMQGLIDGMGTAASKAGAVAKQAPARGRGVATRVAKKVPARKKAAAKPASAKKKAAAKKNAPARKKTAAKKKAPAKKKAGAKKKAASKKPSS
jgi:chemotaxis protein histidine kinase CheA